MMLLANRCIRLLLLLLALALAAGTALADETKTIAGTAHEEVFSTLIRQIESAEDGQSAAFQPQDDPLLTVSLSGTDGTHTLQFYADAQDRSRVYVLCSGKADASTTEAWRVGTILLACEGTQIPEEESHHD